MSQQRKMKKVFKELQAQTSMIRKSLNDSNPERMLADGMYLARRQGRKEIRWEIQYSSLLKMINLDINDRGNRQKVIVYRVQPGELSR